MTRVLYFDCFSGISGDMVLGALLDAGLPLADLQAALGSLALGDVTISARKVLRANVSATKFAATEGHAPDLAQTHDHGHSHDHGHTHDHGHAHDDGRAHDHGHAPDHDHAPDHTQAHAHRSLADINSLIDRSGLSAAGKDRAKALFLRLAEAEAAIHQMPVERVHLHEVGELDSIVDIVGAVFAIEWAGVDRVVCSPLNVGGGMVRSAHGVFPVPAPATVSLLGDAPIYSGRVQKELVTPTGALIATSYATSYGPIPAMSIDRVGYGAGDRDDPETPNVLRVLIGRETAHASRERVVVLECEIDDMNPQLFGVAMDRLLAAGALDVYYVPAQMKKNRPGTLLTVIAPPALRDALTDIVFRETTTIGVRGAEVERACLAREIIEVATEVGPIRFKIARQNGQVINAAPEFEDCLRAATATSRSVKDIQALALRAYGAQAYRS